ncbi:MAG: hypothetical protein AWU57_950 [Marinobacter sp. T13-3]|nr:MAG: hypothetical protein AWU57_950 [Marinobacter sp. T13-3]
MLSTLFRLSSVFSRLVDMIILADSIEFPPINQPL